MAAPLNDAPLAADDERTPTLRRYLNVAIRRRRVVLICLILPVIAAIAYGSQKEAVYQGGAQVVIGRQNLANALTGTPDANQTNNFAEIVKTQEEIARTPTVARRVLAAVPGT